MPSSPLPHAPSPSPPVCRYFLKFITQSRNTRNRLDSAKELKKLVYFSNIVVAPLLEDLKVCGCC